MLINALRREKHSYLEDPNWAYGISRVLLGGVFIFQGALKFLYLTSFTASLASIGFPLPLVCAVVVMAVEFFCGLAVLLGVFTRFSAMLLALDMLVLLFVIQLPNGYGLSHIGVSFSVLAFALALSLVFTGPGKWSVHSLLRR